VVALILDQIGMNGRLLVRHHQLIPADDLLGHMMICPDCGAVREVDEAHGLTMTQLVLGTSSAGASDR
jgi:hypothetical protein